MRRPRGRRPADRPCAPRRKAATPPSPGRGRCCRGAADPRTLRPGGRRVARVSGGRSPCCHRSQRPPGATSCHTGKHQGSMPRTGALNQCLVAVPPTGAAARRGARPTGVTSDGGGFRSTEVGSVGVVGSLGESKGSSSHARPLGRVLRRVDMLVSPTGDPGASPGPLCPGERDLRPDTTLAPIRPPSGVTAAAGVLPRGRP